MFIARHRLVNAKIAHRLENATFDRIELTKISNIYMDVAKAATFYADDNFLVLTFLSVANAKLEEANLVLKKDGRVVFDANIDILKQRPHENSLYIFSMFKQYMNDIICEQAECAYDETMANASLTYRLRINNAYSDESRVNIVWRTENNSLAVRLIKCMWMPDDMKTFDYVMQLIVEARYDVIYICLLSGEYELKQYFKKFSSIVHFIELESIPNYSQGKKNITNFNQIENDTKIEDKVLALDPVQEYLLNQVYPFLVGKYKYVHAGDFDHLLFTRNQTFYERVVEIAEKNKISTDVSIYLNQHWALDNEMSQEIFKDVPTVGENATFPVYLRVKKHRFDLKISDNKQLEHAMDIWSYLESHNSTMFRHVIFTFRHSNIYGQVIHNTKSSMILKLCSAGEFFTGGKQVTAESPHFMHYRENYVFKLHKKNGFYIPVESFRLWPNYDREEF